MKRKDVLDVLDKIDDRHITEAEKAPRKTKKKAFWISAVAAVLAIVICIGSFLYTPAKTPVITPSIKANAIALPEAARVTERPVYSDYKDDESYWAAYDIWKAEADKRNDIKKIAAVSLSPFFTKASEEFLVSEDNENVIWSPINAYIGLSMLAEITDGDTRKEILNLFGTEDIESLRNQVTAVWEAVYKNN